ncbi:MAG: orc1/cdc6 family replication initiation protein [Methanophagales archaeon]|nr:orc1/cdc6 family replication initiation protein [Methanophagales archaeon]
MNKPQPFSCLSAEALEVELIKLMRVNRDDELRQCIDALFGRSENLLLYGSRGVGKTFLVRLLLEEIRSRFEDTLPAFMNMTGLLAYEPVGVVSAFPNAVLLELCRTIWVDVLGNEYSTLRGVLSETGREIKFRKKGEKKVVEIYRLLMTSARRMRVSREYSVGVSAVLKGGTKEDTQREWSEIDTLPFEFFEFVEEIKKETLRPNGKERIIAICDEANKLSIFQQAEILERYLELFAAKQVQFVFVAGYRPGEKVGPVPYGFQNLVELKGFQEKQHVKELIDKHTSTISVSFLDSAIDVVWDVFKGHPLYTINASHYAYEQAHRDGLGRIDARVMAVACMRLLREQEEYRRMLESQSR